MGGEHTITVWDYHALIPLHLRHPDLHHPLEHPCTFTAFKLQLSYEINVLMLTELMPIL